MSDLIITLTTGGGGELATSIEDVPNGVTWNFDGEVTVGTYWNGAPYVVMSGSQIGITSVTPAASNSPRKINGLMVDPFDSAAPTENGFDDRIGSVYGSGFLLTYNDALNVDPANTAQPLTITSAAYPQGVSIVKAVSDVVPTTERTILRYSVLTVVPSAPPANSFRPPVSASNKSQYNYTLSDLDFTKLKSLAPVAGGPLLSRFEGWKHGVPVTWHVTSDADRYLYSRDMRDIDGGYSARVVREIDTALTLLHSNAYNNAEKTDLYASLVQWGLDAIASVDRGMEWDQNWTKSAQFRPLSVLAAVALDDLALKATAGSASPKYPDAYQFYEVDAAAIAEGPAMPVGSQPAVAGQFYQSSQIGLPTYRINLFNRTASLATGYTPTYTYSHPLTALVFDMLGDGEGRTVWNNSTFFDFAMRCHWLFAVNKEPVGLAGLASAPYGQTDYEAGYVDTYISTYGLGYSDPFKPDEILGTTVSAASATAIDVSIPVNGRFVGSSPATQWDVRYSTDHTNWTEVLDVGTSFQITGLSANTVYLIQVRAQNTHGAGPWSHQLWRKIQNDIRTDLWNDGKLTSSDVPINGGEFLGELEKVLAAQAGYEDLALSLLTQCVRTNAS